MCLMCYFFAVLMLLIMTGLLLTGTIRFDKKLPMNRLYFVFTLNTLL